MPRQHALDYAPPPIRVLRPMGRDFGVALFGALAGISALIGLLGPASILLLLIEGDSPGLGDGNDGISPWLFWPSFAMGEALSFGLSYLAWRAMRRRTLR